jgi:hypothetical protein
MTFLRDPLAAALLGVGAFVVLGSLVRHLPGSQGRGQAVS